MLEFGQYWQGKKSFWNAFLIWALVIPLPIIILQIFSLAGIWGHHSDFWKWIFHNDIVNNILNALAPAFWLVAIYPLIYQPAVLKILWVCRYNNPNRWQVAAAFAMYIPYYATSLYIMVASVLWYALSDL